jgi:acylphosphatase
MTKACVQLIVSGKVQGVGFRFSTQQAANTYHIQGWVKNLPDGNVAIRAQGEQAQLSQFIDWAKHGSQFANVHDVAITKLVTQNELTQFSIR